MATENITSPTQTNEVNPDSPKVTIGFKTAPIMKVRLSQEAQERGLTLSEYVESIVSSYSKSEAPNQTVDDLNAKLALYESPQLMELFEREKGETIEFVNAFGRPMAVKVEEPVDIFTIIINCFKSSKS